MLLSLPLFARANLSSELEKLNEDVKKFGDSPQACDGTPSAKANPTSDDLMQKCVESLCPNADFNLSKILDNVYSHAANPGKSFDTELLPIIREIALSEAEGLAVTGKDLLKWLKTNPILKDENAIRIFNFFMFSRDFHKFTFTSSGIDRSASRAAFMHLDEAAFDKKVKIGEKFLFIYANVPFGEKEPEKLKLLYPGDQLAKKIGEVLSEIQAKSKKLASKPNMRLLTQLNSFREMFDDKKLRELFSTNEINPAFIDELNNDSAFLDLLLAVAEDSSLQQMLSSPPIDVKKALPSDIEPMVAQGIENASRFLQKSEMASSSPCSTVYVMAQQILPTRAQVNQYVQTRGSNLKSEFMAKVKNYFSQHSSQVIENESTSWIAHFPQTKEDHFAHMKQSLLRALADSRKWKSEHQEFSKSPDKDSFYAIGAALIDEELNNFFSQAESACEELMPNILPDSAFSKTAGFIIGPLVLRYGQAAEGIAYHELGHLVHEALRDKSISPETKEWFNQTRSCLVENHTEFTVDERNQQISTLKTANNSTYDAEDWADFIASIAEPKQENFGCFFVRKSNPGDYKNLSLKNADVSDPHSSNLYRTLHLNFLKKGSIPAVCHQALAAQGETVGFKNCLIK